MRMDVLLWETAKGFKLIKLEIHLLYVKKEKSLLYTATDFDTFDGFKLNLFYYNE
jgi:hypothetical protein